MVKRMSSDEVAVAQSASDERNASPAAATAQSGSSANEKQLSFLRSIGVRPPANCTLQLASELILRAQNARFYAWRIARQEWGADLDGRALRPIIVAVLRKPKRSQAIVERMDGYLEGLMSATDPEAYAPDFPRDESFAFVRAAILIHHPNLEHAQAKPERLSAKQEQEQLERIRDETEPRFYIGKPTIQDMTRPYRIPLGVAAAFFLILFVWAIWPSGPSPTEAVATTERERNEVKLDTPAEKTEAPKAEVKSVAESKTQEVRLSVGKAYRSGLVLSLHALPDRVSTAGVSLPAGGRFKVSAEHKDEATSWYRVSAFSPDMRPLGRWWLMGLELRPGSLLEIDAGALVARPTEPSSKVPVKPPITSPSSGHGGAKPTRKTYTASLDKALQEYKLPDGRTLNQTVSAIRAAAKAKGLHLWSGKPSYLMMDPRKPEFRVTWTVAWKDKPTSKWTRYTGQWRADILAATVTPANPAAKLFASLENTVGESSPLPTR